MYFGTVARLQVRPGMAEQFLAFGEEQTSQDDGSMVFSIVYQSDTNPNEFYLVVAAASRDAYFERANSPEQHQQYLRMMEMLDAEPEWHDGYVVYTDFG